MKLYSLKCKSLKIYHKPFVAEDDGVAIDLIRTSLKLGLDPSVSLDLEDFSLFCMGEFSSRDGINHARNKHVIDLVQIPGLLDIVKTAMEVKQNAD